MLCDQKKLLSRMSFKTRRRGMYFVCFLTAFMVGSENAIVYPTAWKYLQEIGVHDENFLGLVISAFNVAALISAVLLGVLSDKLNGSRTIVLTFNLLNILGQMLYCLGGNKWMLVLARFTAGIGSGITTPTLAEMVKVTSSSEKNRVLTIAYAARTLGLTLGPAYNLLMEIRAIDLGFIRITETNFPGFLLALIWSAAEVLFFMIYTDAADLQIQERTEADEGGAMLVNETCHSTMVQGAGNEYPKTIPEGLSQSTGGVPMLDENSSRIPANAKNKDSVIENAGSDVAGMKGCTSIPLSLAMKKLCSASLSQIQYGSLGPQQEAAVPPVLKGLGRKYLDACLNDTVVPLLFLQFLGFFIQSAVETTISPVNEFYFGFGARVNSFVYLAIGLEALIVCALSYVLIHYISESVLLVGSCALMVFGCLFTMTVSSQFQRGRPDQFPLFMTGCAMLFLAVPTVSLMNLTIFSKSLPSDVQGFAQGMRKVCSYLGLIMGPLYGGGLVHHGLLLYSAPFVMSILALTLVLASYRKYEKFLQR